MERSRWKLCHDRRAGGESSSHMPSSRAATWLAIAAGALGGAAAALFARHPSQPAPLAPVATLSAAPTPSATATPPIDAEVAPIDATLEPETALPTTHYAPPLPATAGAAKRAALRCAWGHIEPCLQAAVAYRDGLGIAADKGEGKLYMHRARELSIDLCEEGHPEACYALAYMYEHGVGLPVAPDKVPALIARVRMLCRIKATPICRRVAAKPDGG